MKVFEPQKASTHGDSEVLVLGKVSGVDQNVILRNVPDLVVEYASNRVTEKKAREVYEKHIQEIEETVQAQKDEAQQTLDVVLDTVEALRTKIDLKVFDAAIKQFNQENNPSA